MNNNIHKPNGQFKKGMRKEDHPRYTDQAQRIRMRCLHCGKEVRIKPHDYKRSISKIFYCSWEHYKQDKKILLTCEVCGKQFTKYKSDLKTKNRGRFCSKSCMGKILSKGSSNTQWNGGRHKSIAGYIMVHKPDHPNNINGYVRENRLVLEKSLGRYLNKDEVAHHINHIKDDNRVENLQLMTKSVHATHHNNVRWGNK